VLPSGLRVQCTQRRWAVRARAVPRRRGRWQGCGARARPLGRSGASTRASRRWRRAPLPPPRVRANPGSGPDLAGDARLVDARPRADPAAADGAAEVPGAPPRWRPPAPGPEHL